MKKIMFITVAFIMLIGAGFYFLNHSQVTANVTDPSHYGVIDKNWQIAFSESMDPGTFTSETVQILNNKQEAVPVQFEWNDDYTILTLIPPEKGFVENVTYSIIISENVRSQTGKPIRKAYSHRFTAINHLPNIKDHEQLVSIIKERRQSFEPVKLEQESLSESHDSADMATYSNSSSVSQQMSTTNVQVSGIDEGDVVKTDGDYIYFSRDHDIVIMNADLNQSRVISQIKEDHFYPIELYLHQNLLISIGHSMQPLRKNDHEDHEDVITIPGFTTQSTLFFYDVTDPAKPTKIREITIEGFMTATRKKDDYLYLVLNQFPPYHILEEKSDLDIRPFYRDTVNHAESQPIDFDDLYFFPESQDDSFLIIATVNLNQIKEEVNIESYLGASDQLYMSARHMYVATTDFPDLPKEKKSRSSIVYEPPNTKIYQFSIDNGKVEYHASTIVNGSLINQFAMDERDHSFRVATTKGHMWDENKPSTNNIYTFDLDLNPLGAVEGLAQGEQIFSVRFMDDVAYMVTFKQVDPLFVIDLSDARHPKVLGELKIPGFSQYLHPLDDQHVIGFGQHTEMISNRSNEPTVRVNGIKISVFDVSDPVNPQEKYTEVIGQGNSYTELNYNHKVLYQHPNKNLYGFPAVIFNSKLVSKGEISYYEDYFNYEGAMLYEITPEEGIKLVKTITHQEKISHEPYFDWWPSHIVRILSIGDVIYTLSYDKMKLYDLETDHQIATIPLPDLEY